MIRSKIQHFYSYRNLYLFFYPIADKCINNWFCCFGSDAATLCLKSQLCGRMQCPAHSNIWSVTHHKLNIQWRILRCLAFTDWVILQDLRRHLWLDSILLTPCNIFYWSILIEQTRNPRVVPCFYFIQPTPPGVPLHTYVPTCILSVHHRGTQRNACADWNSSG